MFVVMVIESSSKPDLSETVNQPIVEKEVNRQTREDMTAKADLVSSPTPSVECT